MLFLFVMILGVSALGWELRRRKVPPPMDAGLFMRFALLPGERHGTVWAAAHPSGEPMIATITSTGAFALNYSVAQAPPVRLRPEGAAVAVGAAVPVGAVPLGVTQTITPPAAEPMVDVNISVPGQPPLSFRIAHSGAKALSAWAIPVA